MVTTKNLGNNHSYCYDVTLTSMGGEEYFDIMDAYSSKNLTRNVNLYSKQAEDPKKVYMTVTVLKTGVGDGNILTTGVISLAYDNFLGDRFANYNSDAQYYGGILTIKNADGKVLFSSPALFSYVT